MKKFLTLLPAILLFAWLGCGGNKEGSETKPVIAYTSKDLSNPFFNIIGDTLKTEAAKHGYDVVVVDGIDVGDLDYLDIGLPMGISEVVPVTVKSLIFPTKEER